MANRILTTIAIVAATLCATLARSEDDPLPNNMLGFLRPGLRVGIQTVDGTTNILLNVYTEDQYGIARDLASLGRSAVAGRSKFADDHPVLRKKLDAFVERLVEKSPDANVDKVIVFPLSRQSFGSIAAIGDDYVLIDREASTKHRLIFGTIIDCQN